MSAAIVLSMMVSLTMTPMMCAHLLKPQRPERQGWFFRGCERAFDAMLAGYRHTLAWALDNRLLLIVVLALTIALNVVLVMHVPKGFFPEQDTGVIFGGVQGAEDTSFTSMDASVKALVDTIKKDPAVAHVNVFTGASNHGFIFIALEPLDKRDASALAVIGRLRRATSRLPVASAFLQAAQDVRVGGRASNAQYQVHDPGGDERRPREVGTAPARQDEAAAGIDRRQLRSAERWPQGLCDLRSHARLRTRDHAGAAR